MNSKELIRRLTPLVERCPELISPYINDDEIQFLFTNECELRETASALGGIWTKEVSEYFFVLSQERDGGTIKLKVVRELICERKVVGQKFVEGFTTQDHYEDIVEWECPDSFLEATK